MLTNWFSKYCIRTSIHFIYYALFIFLLAFVAYRAFNLSITHDEALSFSILQGNEGLRNTANHHLLNTWLMQVSFLLFGASEFSLRLPNVLAFVLYLIVSIQLLKVFDIKIALLIGIPLLLLNTYLLDFFSLARGYGLSIGFMLLSLAFYLKFFSQNITSLELIKNFCFSMLSATIALTANLNLINFYIAIGGLMFLHFLILKRQESKIRIRFILLNLLFLLPLFFALLRLIDLKNTGQLYHGVENFDDSLYSLTISSFDLTYCAGVCPHIIMNFVKMIFPTIFIYVWWKKAFNAALFKIWLVFFIILVGIFIEHWLFSALYPWNRTSVYLIPLFGYLIFLFIVDVLKGLEKRYYLPSLITLLFFFSAPFYFHFVKKIDLDVVTEWRYDAHSKDVVSYFEKEGTELTNNEKTILTANWVFLPSIDYTISRKKLHLESAKLETVPNINSRYLYDFISNDYDSAWVRVKTFEDIETALYLRR